MYWDSLPLSSGGTKSDSISKYRRAIFFYYARHHSQTFSTCEGAGTGLTQVFSGRLSLILFSALFSGCLYLPTPPHCPFLPNIPHFYQKTTQVTNYKHNLVCYNCQTDRSAQITSSSVMP